MNGNERTPTTPATATGRSVKLPPPQIRSVPKVRAEPGHLEASRAAGPDDRNPGEALTTSLQKLITGCQDQVTLARETVALVSSLPRVVAAAWFTAAPSGTLRTSATSWSGFAFERDSFRKGLAEACHKALASGTRHCFSDAESPNLTTWCLPVMSSGTAGVVSGTTEGSAAGSTAGEVLTVSWAATREELEALDARPLELVLSAVRLWHSERLAAVRDAELQGLAALVELVQQIEQAPSAAQACHAVVNELREYLGCHRVALGLRRRSGAGCRLTTLSGTAAFDEFSDVARQFQAACDETSIRESLVTWPLLNPQQSQPTIALRQLTEQQNLEAAIGLPLISNRMLVGVLICAGPKLTLLESRTQNLLRTAAPMLSSALHLARRAEGNWLSQSWRQLMSSRWSVRLTILSVLAAVAAVLCMPWPYRMNVSCTLEPKVRRIVSAPYDGLLEVSLAEPGSVVQQGQVLAVMDAREIRWELSTITAERSQALKEYDTELAKQNIAKAQLARMEAERLRKKLDLLQYREQNHELLCPIEGMVLTGSLDKLTGAPVKTGQPLFEVAELNPLRLELAVPAEDYFHIRTGQTVSVAFDGFSGHVFEGTITKIRLRSEVRGEKNVFVAEMEIPNPDLRLRPGIQGYATITGDKHPVAWNIFHKAWESLRRTDPSALLADNQAARLKSLTSSGAIGSRLAATPRPVPQMARQTPPGQEQADASETRVPGTRIVEAPEQQSSTQ